MNALACPGRFFMGATEAIGPGGALPAAHGQRAELAGERRVARSSGGAGEWGRIGIAPFRIAFQEIDQRAQGG